MKLSIKNIITFAGIFVILFAFTQIALIAYYFQQSDPLILATAASPTILMILMAGFVTAILNRVIGSSIQKLSDSIYQLAKGELSENMKTNRLNCSEARNCGNENCPEYGKETNSCFIDVGSYAPLIKNEILCPAILKGKFKSCQECAVMNRLASNEQEYLNILLDVFRNKVGNVIREAGEMIYSTSGAMNEMKSATENLTSSAQNQAAVTEEISATVQQVSFSVDRVAEGVTEQFQGIVNLNEKMSELSNSIQEFNEKAQKTLVVTESLSNQASFGSKSLIQMNDSMGKIIHSSGEMNNIINIITGISEKINLLSLNAAIEAARAGEAGRGFAVVADEISKLADQTANSIKHIGNLISESEREVSKGMVNVSDTVKTIGAIIDGVNQIKEMTEIISTHMEKQITLSNQANIESQKIKQSSEQIKQAVIDQKRSFHEISISITSMNESTQSNASSSEEIAASASEIQYLTDRLKKEIAFFS